MGASHLHPCADLEIVPDLFGSVEAAKVAADMAALHKAAARDLRQFLVGQGGEQFLFLFGVELLEIDAGQINFLFHTVASSFFGAVPAGHFFGVADPAAPIPGVAGVAI